MQAPPHWATMLAMACGGGTGRSFEARVRKHMHRFLLLRAAGHTPGALQASGIPELKSEALHHVPFPLAPTWPMPQLPDRSRLTVTAGLRWQPDTWPMEKAETIMPMPKASAVTTPKDELVVMT